MKISAALLAILVVVAIALTGWEIAAQGKVLLVIFSACTVTAVMFSLSREYKAGRPIVLSDYEGQDVLEATVPGGAGVKIKGNKLPERLLGDRTVILALICAMAWFMWWHHTTTETLLQKTLDTTAENTYVLSLSQADREKLNLAMPESLRRKIRRE